MLDEVKRLVALGLKLVRGEAIGAPAAEGYFARGITRNVVAGASAADRATAMLLDKLAGRPFASEVPRPAFPQRPGAAAGQDAARAPPSRSSPTAAWCRAATPTASRR